MAGTALKEKAREDLHVTGSAKLTQTLIEHELVDVIRLMIDPVLLAGASGPLSRMLRLLEHRATTKGAILATYAIT